MSAVLRTVFVAAAWLASSVAPPSARADAIDVAALEPFACSDDMDTIDRTMVRHCGHLPTPERIDALSQNIELAVVVLIPSDRTRAARTPTVVLHGGPGYGIVEDWWSVAMLPFAAQGPVIIFDQRFVGRSTPHLCAFLDEDDPALDEMPPAALKDVALRDAKRCVTSPAVQSSDPARFGTAATVRDMETLRRALRIEKWNLYGGSYGTTVGLAYIAAHPDRVRAAVLDSVYPPEAPGFSKIVPDAVAGLRAMNGACAGQPGCRRFGDIEAALGEAIEMLDGRPLPVEAIDPETLERRKRHVSGTALYGMVQSMMLQSPQWPLVPVLVADARNRRASALLGAVAGDFFYEATQGNFGAYLSTECFERAPFDDAGDLARQAARWPAFARAAAVETLLETCALWPFRAAAPLATPANTPVPTLVVAGEWDPVTPAEHARRTAETLGSHAQFLLVPKAAHGPTFTDPCAGRLAAAFLADPAAKLDARCNAGRGDPVFATRLIELDAMALMRLSLSFLPVLALIFAAGLLSTLAWPLAAAYRAAAGRAEHGRPLWRRSAPWLTAAAFGLAAWSYPPAAAWLGDDDAKWYWLRYGIPAESWPAFPALVLPLVAALTGAWAFARETKADALDTFQVIHRGFVLFALGAAALVLLNLGLLTQAVAHAIEDAGRLLGGAW